jgi:uncharacterized protein (TIGR01777 family)
MKILLTGATGFIGKQIVARLQRDRHQLVILTRNAQATRKSFEFPCDIYSWNPTQGLPPAEAFNRVEAVIHLAGESVAAGRWTADQKKRIYTSRVDGTRHLLDAIASLGESKPKVLISASAIGFYGNREDQVLSEESSAGSGFLAEVCQAWEAESIGRQVAGLRQVAIRTGVVLGREGGALRSLLRIFNLGLGGHVGNGKQWMSWIHNEDLVALYCKVLEDSGIQGPLNAVSPNPVRNSEFSKILGQVLHRPSMFPVPGPLLRLALGEMASLVLGSQRVLPNKALQHHFQFKFVELKAALTQICSGIRDEELKAVQHFSKGK